MYKGFKFFSFLFLSILWINSALNAVGGTGAEEVLEDEVKRKGVLKIRSGSLEGTGVLFQEGRGQLGLSVKHVFKEYLTRPSFVCFGKEVREIVKVYTPKSESDLALFVLRSPFMDIEELPSLPGPLSPSSPHEGYCYGFGTTTASTHPGALENSGGVCRKGKILFSPFPQINPIAKRCLLGIFEYLVRGFTRFDDRFISFSIPQKSEKSAQDTEREIHKNHLMNTILGKKNIPTINQDDDLPPSPSYVLQGDSGGPLIVNDIVYGLTSNLSNKINMDDTNVFFSSDCVLRKLFNLTVISSELAERSNSNGQAVRKTASKIDSKELVYRELFKISYDDNNLGIGFIEPEELCVELKNETSSSISQKTNTVNAFYKDVRNYFMNDDSQHIHSLVRKEAENKAFPPLFTQWLEKTFLYSVSYFTSLCDHRDWIERKKVKAFKYCQSGKIEKRTVCHNVPDTMSLEEAKNRVYSMNMKEELNKRGLSLISRYVPDPILYKVTEVLIIYALFCEDPKKLVYTPEGRKFLICLVLLRLVIYVLT